MATTSGHQSNSERSDGLEESPFIDIPKPVNKHVNENLKPKDPPSWTENFSYYFSQFCGASSIHGVQYLGERGRFMIEKVVWAIIIIVVWYFCIMLIAKTYNKWRSTPVIVTFSTTEKSVSELPFPSVSICPSVQFDPDVFNFTDVLLRKVQKKVLTDDEIQKFESYSLICSNTDEILAANGIFENGSFTVNESTIRYVMEAFPSHSFDNVSSASWLGDDDEMANLLSRSISSEGICYSFNMLDPSEILEKYEDYITHEAIDGTKAVKWSLDGGYPTGNNFDVFPKRTFLSGMNGGFQAILYTNHSKLDYLCGDLLQGFKVTLHHPCELPDMDKHFRVPLDQAVLVAVKPRMITISEELKFYDPEDRKCYLVNERRLKFFKSYTQQNCLVECLSNYTLLKCGCVPFYLPKYKDSPICGSGSQNCTESSKVNYLLNAESNCNCLPSCTSLQYDVEISQSNWDWREAFRAFGVLNDKYKEFQFLSANSHFSVLQVYYKEMQFLTSERHELYGLVDFFSNTGGLLGLFIGFSVTSAIEILYFLTLRLACNIRRFGQVFWSGEADLISAHNIQQS